MSWETTPAGGEQAWGDTGYSNDARNGDDGGGGGGDGGCFNCGQEGHMKSECPEPRTGRDNSGLCYNCGQEGHNKSDCPNPRIAGEFSGACRICDLEGHRTVDCPAAPPQTCKNCEQEGHLIGDCKNARKINRSGVADAEPEQSWDEMVAAAAEKDLDDFKIALQKYLKTCPTLTYLTLEEAFRAQGIPIYIIALERELSDIYTNMDLQGNLGKTYSVSYRFSDKPRRPKEREGWPTTAENKERLLDAGEAVDCRLSKCTNCNALGHTSKYCTEEKQEAVRAQVLCYNCDQIGHRVRDCPNERSDRFACRNCQKTGHGAKECPEPRTGGGPCRNCNQEGHRAAECTNERVMICRNCDAEGHTSKECTEKKDWSRVKCSNCQQNGHGKARCTEPLKEEEDDAGDGDADAAAGGGSGGWGAAAPSAAAVGESNGW